MRISFLWICGPMGAMPINGWMQEWVPQGPALPNFGADPPENASPRPCPCARLRAESPAFRLPPFFRSSPAMSAPRYDLVVIGAGPAGSAAALCAARAGLRVALVDKARFPRVKLCGGLVTGRALRALRQPLPADLLERRDSLSVFDRGAPLGQITGGSPVYLTTRLGLDAHLLAQALQAGAEDFTGHPVAGLAPGFVQLRDGAALRAPLILGADGVNSAVARHLFGRAFDPATIGFALEIEAPPSEDQSLQVDFGVAAWGYGWRFAKSGSTTIGVGGLQARNPDMKARLAAYLALLPDQAGARVMGHHLPFGELRRVPGHGRMLLAGDAAGLVDPITGEGIAHAL
ncbi:MAG TPA: hypothetical protein DEB47_18655, partial [Citreicella sp.]|nr:hypothetical protein [Citreicella sp.]